MKKEASAKSRDPVAFSYVHYETTGITDYITIQGKERAIQCRPRSNETARKSLSALKWNILYANADGKRIFLIGRLDPVRRRTASGPDRATSETYQEFELQGWRISSPFEELIVNDSDVGDPNAVNRRKRSSLRRTDFDEFKGRETFDLRRLQ